MFHINARFLSQKNEELCFRIEIKLLYLSTFINQHYKQHLWTFINKTNIYKKRTWLQRFFTVPYVFVNFNNWVYLLSFVVGLFSISQHVLASKSEFIDETRARGIKHHFNLRIHAWYELIKKHISIY